MSLIACGSIRAWVVDCDIVTLIFACRIPIFSDIVGNDLLIQHVGGLVRFLSKYI